MKHICDCRADSFLCAGVSEAVWVSDTNNSHYSFAIFDVAPEDFAQAIEELIECSEVNAENKELVLYGVNVCDTIRMTLDSNTLAITRGNLKVLYHGYVGTLSGLPKVIRKAMQVWERKLDKETT